MPSLSCAVIGDSELPGELGRLGSHSDIALYNRRVDDLILSFVAPLTFPEKIQSLLTAIQMAHAAIVVVREVTPALGEAIVALDSLNVTQGLIVLDGAVKEQVTPLIKGTALEGYGFCEKTYASIIPEVMKMKAAREEGALRLPIDHFFLTKTVGTVAIGRVERGVIGIHDRVLILPPGKEAVVKSLQSQDENVREAGCGVRAGVALKGVDADELERGYIIAHEKDGYRVGCTVSGSFKVSPFFRDPLKTGQKVLATIGLQTEAAVVTEVETGGVLERGGSARITFETDTGKELVHEPGEPFILTRPEVKGLRIVGAGTAG